MASDPIDIKITGNASGFRSAVDEASKLQDMLRGKLIELKQEHVASGRVARFYATEISSMVPASEAAREAIQSLVKVVLAEGAFGVAIAGVGLLVASFHAVSEAIDHSKEHFKKLEEDSEQYAKKIQKHVADVTAALRGETEAEKVLHDASSFLIEKIGLTRQLAAVQEELDDIGANTDENGAVADVVALNEATKRQIELKTQLAAINKNFGESVGGAGEIGSETAQAARRKVLSEELNASIQRRTEMLAAENIVSTQLWIKAVDQDHAEAELLRLKKEQAQADAQAVLDAERLVSPLIAVADSERMTAERAAILAEEMRIQEAEAKKLAHELGQAAKALGDAMGQNLADVLKGTESIDDALKNVLATLIKVATQIALMQVLSVGGPLGILGGIAIGTIGGALSGLFGGGGGGGGQTNHITINGSGLSSRQMESAVVNALRSAQRRGRY